MKDFKLLSKRQERLMKWIEIDLKKVPNLKVNDSLIKSVFVYYLLISNIVQKDICDVIATDFANWRYKNPRKFIKKYLPEIDDNHSINPSTYKKDNYEDVRDHIFEDSFGYLFINMHH